MDGNRILLSDANSVKPMQRPTHIAALDGLRGIAALAVVWYHFPRVSDSPLTHIVYGVLQKPVLGPLAVDVFFVMSGFLITRIILCEVAAGRFSVRNFLIKRALRIFPIYYITLIVVACWQPISGRWIAAACYVSNYTDPFDHSGHMFRHMWSLAVEEQFYLLWPFLFVCLRLPAIRRFAWPVGPFVALSGAVLALLCLDSFTGPALVYRGLPFRMLTLLLGATFAFHEAAIRRWPGWLVGCGAVVCYIGLAGAELAIRSSDAAGYFWVRMLASACTSFLIVQFVVAANERTGLCRGVLTCAPLQWCGKISYGIYLYHVFILYAMAQLRGADGPSNMTFSLSDGVLIVALCLGIPSVSYLVVERPLLRLKSRLTTPPARPDSDVITPAILNAGGTRPLTPAA